MSAKLLTGKEVASKIESDILHEISQLNIRGVHPKLKIMAVGETADATAYINSAKKIAEKLGILCEIEQLPATSFQQDFRDALHRANADKTVHGIIVMSPLPPGISEALVKQELAPEKDVDCVTYVGAGRLMADDITGFSPATAKAVIEICSYYDVPLHGANAVIIGRSMVVGKPLSMLLLRENATVTICHSKSRNLSEICGKADILIAAIGRPKMIGKEFVRPGAVVIDVGINVVDGKLCGDVDAEAVKEIAAAITPVPGGVGAVTTRVLMQQVVKAAKIQNL